MNELYMQYQKQLIFASLEDFNEQDVMSGYRGGQFSSDNSEWWKASVEFLYRNLKCGFLEVQYLPDGVVFDSVEDLCAQIYRKKSRNNFLLEFVYFVGSKKLDKFISKYFLHSWASYNGEFNKNFFNDLKSVYEKECVGFEVEVEKKFLSKCRL